MPLLTEQADPDTVVTLTEQADPGTVLLNALEDDIHNNSISILSPGGHNLIELPILRCQDVDTETETPQEEGDIVSQAMSASNVISDNETVCVWSQNLNTSTQLTIFSPPPDSVDAVPGTDTHVTDSSIRDLEIQVQDNVPVKDYIQKSVKKSSKKKLNLDNVDNARKQLVTSSAARDTNTQFCQPGEMLIAEPFHSTNPQKKIFMRSLNFGPNAGTTKGSMMPSRKAAKGSALAPFTRKKSTDKSSDFSTVSVNLTKDIRYRKIMPKPSGQIPVAINIVPANQTSEMAATEETVTATLDSAEPSTDDNDHAVLCTDDNDHYDSDTLSCGTFSPMKRRSCDKLPSQNNSKSKTGDQTSYNKLNPKANPKQSKSPRKINPTKTHKDSSVGGQKLVSPKSRTPSESRQTKKSPNCSQKETKKAPKCSQKETKKSQKCTKKVNDDKLMAVCDEKKLNEANANTVNQKGDLKNNQAADNNNHDKGNEMKKSQTETLQSEENSETGKGKTVSRRGKNKEVSNKRQEQESSKEINTKDTLKKGRKKTVRSLMKVKIVSSKIKSPTDRDKQLKLCKSGNKIFMKSPVIREQKKSKTKSVEITTDSDTDEELPLNVLKDLHKNADDVFNETVQEVDEAVKVSGKQKEASAEQNSKLNEPVPDFCPRTPEKAVKSPVNPDTPSQEQVLEKLGLTPKKNAEEILQNLQSPSRKLLDMFVQLTPVDKRKTPRRRKGQNHSDGNSMRSPSRSIKTPNKRLFGSPHKVAANPSKTAAKSDVASQSTSARPEKSVVQNKKSKPKSDKVDVGKNGDNDSDLEPRKDKVVKNAEKEKSKPTVKGKGKLIMKEKSKPSVKSSQEDKEKKFVENKKSQSLESLKKEEKTVTPLKLINLLGEIKVDCARNKQSKGSKKRQRDDSDKELENEVKSYDLAKEILWSRLSFDNDYRYFLSLWTL